MKDRDILAGHEVLRGQPQGLPLIRDPKRAKGVRRHKPVRSALRFRPAPGPHTLRRSPGDARDLGDRQQVNDVGRLAEGCANIVLHGAIRTEIAHIRQAGVFGFQNIDGRKEGVSSSYYRRTAMKLVEEIRRRLKNMPRGKTQGELAERLGIARTGVNNIAAGRRRIFAEELPVIIDYLEIDGAFELAPQASAINLLALSGTIEAGVWREADMHQANPEKMYPKFPTQRYANAPQYLLELRGESMNRHYRSGDVIYCVPLDHATLSDGAHVHVERTDADGRVETTLKVYRETPNGIELRPDSDDPRFQTPIKYDDKEGSSVEIRGVVIGSFRGAPA